VVCVDTPLMAPYLMWVTFARALTGEIWRLNPEVGTCVFWMLEKRLHKEGAGGGWKHLSIVLCVF
jgi:hypothetical protein